MILKNVTSELANKRLDKVASILFQTYSRTRIKKWILEGRVLVNGEISNPKDHVHESDEIEINPIEQNKVTAINGIHTDSIIEILFVCPKAIDKSLK